MHVGPLGRASRWLGKPRRLKATNHHIQRSPLASNNQGGPEVQPPVMHWPRGQVLWDSCHLLPSFLFSGCLTSRACPHSTQGHSIAFLRKSLYFGSSFSFPRGVLNGEADIQGHGYVSQGGSLNALEPWYPHLSKRINSSYSTGCFSGQRKENR